MDRRVKDIATGGGLNIDPVRFSPSVANISALGTATGPLSPNQSAGGISINFEAGSIQGTNAKEIVDEILQALRDKSRAQTGDTNDWGRLV
jgi:hypothetical protein